MHDVCKVRRERRGAGGGPGAGLSLLLGLHRCGKHTDDDGDHREALSKDASSHQQLGLPGLALMEGAEPVHESSCCSQATWKNRQRGQAMRGGPVRKQLLTSGEKDQFLQW